MFDVNYLGGHMPTFALNFSRPGSEVIAQYFMFTSLGREGYRRVMQSAQDVAHAHVERIAELGPYRLISTGDASCPCSRSPSTPEVENYTVFDVSDRLRQRGWLVPAYSFPENRRTSACCASSMRAGMNREMADLLLEHLRRGDRVPRVARRTAARARRRERRKAFAH